MKKLHDVTKLFMLEEQGLNVENYIDLYKIQYSCN